MENSLGKKDLFWYFKAAGAIGAWLFATWACAEGYEPPPVNPSLSTPTPISGTISSEETPLPLDATATEIAKLNQTAEAQVVATATALGSEGLEKLLSELPEQYVKSAGILESEGGRGSALVLGISEGFTVILTKGTAIRNDEGTIASSFTFLQPHMDNAEVEVSRFGMYTTYPNGPDIAVLVFTQADGSMSQGIGYGLDKLTSQAPVKGEHVRFLGFPGILQSDPFPASGTVTRFDEDRVEIESSASSPGASGTSALDQNGNIFGVLEGGVPTNIVFLRIPDDMPSWILGAQIDYIQR